MSTKERGKSREEKEENKTRKGGGGGKETMKGGKKGKGEGKRTGNPREKKGVKESVPWNWALGYQPTHPPFLFLLFVFLFNELKCIKLILTFIIN